MLRYSAGFYCFKIVSGKCQLLVHHPFLTDSVDCL